MMVGRIRFAVACLLIIGLAEPVWAQRDRTRAMAIQKGWVFNYQQARREAAAANKPMMIVFRCVP